MSHNEISRRHFVRSIARDVSLEIDGPGVIVGDNPFHLAESGGAGAVWIRTKPRSEGRVRINATHSTLGTRSIDIRVSRANPG